MKCLLGYICFGRNNDGSLWFFFWHESTVAWNHRTSAWNSVRASPLSRLEQPFLCCFLPRFRLFFFPHSRVKGDTVTPSGSISPPISFCFPASMFLIESCSSVHFAMSPCCFRCLFISWHLLGPVVYDIQRLRLQCDESRNPGVAAPGARVNE